MPVRLDRVAKAMRQEIGYILAYDMNDPRIGFATVTRVEVAADIRSAKVHVAVLGDEKVRKSTLAGLRHARGYLQKEAASRLRMKFTPTLSFYLDDGPAKAVRISKLIDEVMSESRHTPSPESSPLEEGGEEGEGAEEQDDHAEG